MRCCVYYDAPELLTGLIDTARRDAEYERQSEEEPVREMRTVRPQREAMVG